MDKNLYAYCDNNPVMREDPNGNLWTEILVGAALGVTAAALGASASAVIVCTVGATVGESARQVPV